MSDETVATEETAAEEKPAAKKATRKTTAKKAPAKSATAKSTTTKKAPAKKKTTTRKTAAKKTDEPKADAGEEQLSLVDGPEPAVTDEAAVSEQPVEKKVTRKRRTTKKPVDADEGDAVKEPADAGETATMETAGADDEAKPQEVTETPEQASEVAADGETSADDSTASSETAEEGDAGEQREGKRRNRRNRRNRNNHQRKEIVPSATRDELAVLDDEALTAKAIELGVDASEYGERDDLVSAVYDALLQAEGFVMVEGILDLLPDGYGFIRTSGYLPGEHDVYVGVSTVRRQGLRKGDYITGRVRPPRENEKYPALNTIVTLNDEPFEGPTHRVKFANLTPVYPDERLIMEHGKDTLTARAIDLVAPIGKGQRGLIVSPPKAGKTTVLKDIAAAISANNPDVHLMCLLVDERPEEVTDMERTVKKAEVISSTFDEPPQRHVQVCEMVLEKAKRLVERKRDVVILMDSITRLGRAYNAVTPSSGRVLSGGLDANALQRPKRIFGAARNIEEGGSLTIIATALIDTGSRMDEVIFEEFKGTGNMEIYLDRHLAEKRIFPAIDINRTGTRKEDLLLSDDILNRVWILRKILAPMSSIDSMEFLLDKMRGTKSNKDFMDAMGK